MFRFNSSRTFAANLYGGCNELQFQGKSADRCGWARVLEATLFPLVALGLLRPDHGTYRLTALGYARYHDLERWVTYHFIEPLWAQMLAEHRAEGSHVPWAQTAHGRTGAGWRTADRLFRRPLPERG